MNFEEFCDELNGSPWMGAICEVGVGLPFQAMYVNHPGASRTVLFSECPYSKFFQPNDIPRSVSHEMASRYAWNNYWKCLENSEVQNDHLFSVAVSAAHKMGNLYKDGKRCSERGQSHGWVSVVAGVKGDAPKAFSFHWRLNKTKVDNCVDVPMDRETGGRIVANHIAWFLNKVLLDGWSTWEDAINNLPKSKQWPGGDDFGLEEIWIDVIRAPDISIKEHLMLAGKYAPLVYHHGEFKRPVDYIRKYNRTYRGSFNPVTISHEAIGAGSMFEISLDNARKGKISLGDIVHRIRMLDLVERPVLITSGLPLFVDLHKELLRLDGTSMEYLVGVDTFNAVVNEKFIRKDEDFFRDFRVSNPQQSGRFVVIPREGCDLAENEYTDDLSCYVINSEHLQFPGVSSSGVREDGKLGFVSERVRKYIRENELYGYKKQLKLIDL